MTENSQIPLKKVTGTDATLEQRHVHLPPTEDMLLDKAAFEDCIQPSAHNNATSGMSSNNLSKRSPNSNSNVNSNNSSNNNNNNPVPSSASSVSSTNSFITMSCGTSLTTVCERMSEDNLEDCRAFHDLSDISVLYDQTSVRTLEPLGECGSSDEESDEEDNDSSVNNASDTYNVNKSIDEMMEMKDILTDRRGVEGDIPLEITTSISGSGHYRMNNRSLSNSSLDVITERLAADDLLDDKCFVELTPPLGNSSVRSLASLARVIQPTLLEEEEDGSDFDDEEENNDVLKQKDLSSTESLQQLIEVISDPEQWRQLQQLQRNRGSKSNSGSRSSSDAILFGNDNDNTINGYSNEGLGQLSRKNSIGHEHEHIPPTVDMLTDKGAFEDYSCSQGNHHVRRESITTTIVLEEEDEDEEDN